ncbi:MAG TPA: type II toxin-antitoxin system VapC family toxin [Acidisarcina sp.]
MPPEPGLVDANVLVYAMDEDSPQFAASRAILDAARLGSTILYVTPQILCEFYSVVTNGRRVSKPRSPAEGLAALSNLLAFLYVLPVPASTVDGLIALLHQRPVTGADVFDLQIVATMRANNISRIYTFNSGDFDFFLDLEVLTPRLT